MISFLATINYIHFKKIAYFSLRTKTVMVSFSNNIASAMVSKELTFQKKKKLMGLFAMTSSHCGCKLSGDTIVLSTGENIYR